MSVVERIEEQLKSHPVVLYMKGTPDFPMCGFSSQVSQALQQCGVEFSYVNVLEDQEIREGLKSYANWPTYPQLYINGELVGGCDITLQLFESGELKQMLETATA